jgi:peptidyl-prolyl cis-trans isomerase D
MALIGKIREKSGWAIGIIAAGLGLFIVGGDIISPTSMLRGKSTQTVGEICGKEIPVVAFEQEVNQLKYNYYMQTNQVPSQEQNEQFSQEAWNMMLIKIAYQKEFDALGLVVGKEEEIDMVQGKNIHPAIFQSFRNPQTGQFDVNYVKQYLNNINRMEQKAQMQWFTFEKQLAPFRLRQKYESLMKNTVYVTKEEAKREYITQVRRADIKYLFVPFTVIPDNETPINDSDIEEYVSKNESMFPKEASANLEYISFSIIPSKADSLNYLKDLADIKTEFKTSDDDSNFVVLNADKPTPPYWTYMAQLPDNLKSVGNLEKGNVYGPFAQESTNLLYKIVDTKTDTTYAAKASHILFKADLKNPDEKKAVTEKANKVLDRIKKGEKFEILAAEFGSDGTANNGGDLGWFEQGRMVKEFEKAVFASNTKGLLPNLVETQFGLHIVKVTETKTNKKVYVATLDKAITAGDETRDSVYKKAENIALNSTDADQFNFNVAKVAGLNKISAPYVNPSNLSVGGLREGKEIVRWVFNDAKEGDVSPIFEVENQYIVAVLNQKYETGKINIAVNKQQIAYMAFNEKKAQKIIEKIGADNTNMNDVVSKIGSSVAVNSANDVTLISNSLGSSGFEPEAIGTVFGLKEGSSSKPFKGTTGVYMVQAVKFYPIPGEVTDYNYYKNQVLSKSNMRVEYALGEAIRFNAKVIDTRYRFF